MSQKGEKYARRMERRVDKLEQDVAAITTEQTTQGVRISAVEDDLAVYRAAVSARELKQAAAEVKAAKERRTARAAERERKARRRNKVLAFIALALFVAVCVVMVAKAYSEEPAAEPTALEASAAPAAILPTELLFTGPDGFPQPGYYKLDDIGKKLFYTAAEAAALAKSMTEKYERTWGWIGAPEIPMARPWEKLLEVPANG